MADLHIAILGPQGSGKGTQAALISQKYEITHVDLGHELRDRQKINDELGKVIRETISRGELLPDHIPFKILKEKLENIKKGFILDGFPRDSEQLAMTNEITTLTLALYIKISDEEAVKRLEKRRICDKCGKIYTWNEGMSSICECKGNIVQREDDKPEAILKRLALYHKETELLIREYSDKKILREINGEQTVEEVFSEICTEIDSIL